jgi:hypothetical protein
MRRFAVLLLSGGLIPIFAGLAGAAVSGEFLVVQNVGAGQGGIYGIDATGANTFGIIPGSGSGFGENGPPYGSPDVWDFTQARNNGRIAFTSGRVTGDSTRVYVMNGDGTGATQVTFHNPSAAANQAHFRPSISADGSRIAYINAENIAPAGSISTNQNCSGTENTALWVVNADGSNPHVVRQQYWPYASYCNGGAVQDAVISPDGTKIAVKDTYGNESSCTAELVIINIDGSNPNIIHCYNGNNYWGDPSNGLDWSPDGTKLVASIVCGGSCTQWMIYNTSTWTATTTIPTPSGNDQFLMRFSPDSTMLSYFDNNDPNGGKIHIMDLSGNAISSFNLPGINVSPGGFAGALWWGSSSPGILQSMTLGISSVYVNSCPNFLVQLKPSTFNSSGALVTHGYTGANGNITSGDGASWHVDGFGNAYFNSTRSSGSGTLQLSNFGVSSNIIPLTADPSCTCQTAQSGLTVKRGPQRLVHGAQQQFVQTLTVTNTGSTAVAAPINVVIGNLPGTAIVTNASGTSGCASSGSAFMTVLSSGSLAPGAAVSVQMQSRDPENSALTYSTAVVSGAGAP